MSWNFGQHRWRRVFAFSTGSSRIILPRRCPDCSIVKLEPAMSEAEMKELIDRLQRINRRWKIFALISTSILSVMLLATGVVLWKRVEAEREAVLKAMAQ